MAITKVINVDVNTGDANAELEKLEGSFKDVDKAAEKTNKSVDDVASNGGAIAILDQLTGGLATRFRDAFEASKLFNLSLKGTRTALIATGIGAFVVALGLVVAYWDDIVEFITQSNKKLQESIDLQKESVKDLEIELGFNDQILKSLELQGKSTDEQLKVRRKIIKEIQQDLILENSLLQTQLLKEQSKAKELTLLEKFVALQSGFAITEGIQTEEELARQKEIADQINANQKAIIDFQNQLLELDQEDEETGVGGLSEEEKARRKRIDEERAGGDAESLNGLTPEGQAILDAEKLLQELSLAQTDEFLREQADLREAAAIALSLMEIKWADLTAEGKLGIISKGLGAVANLIDEQSVAGKGIAIAQTGINTAQGIMSALTLPPPASFIAAALVGATGIAQTVKIAKQKIPSATGRGFVSGGAGGSGGGASAPAFNLVEGTSDSQINDSINLQNNEPTRAVVVAGDVTTAQSVNRNIVTESGL